MKRWGFEALDGDGNWSASLVGEQDASNTFETEDEARNELGRLATILDIDFEDLRVVPMVFR